MLDAENRAVELGLFRLLQLFEFLFGLFLDGFFQNGYLFADAGLRPLEPLPLAPPGGALLPFPPFSSAICEGSP